MKLHFLVEGPADAAFLERLLPRLIPGTAWQIYPHQGKGRLPRRADAPVDPARRGLLDNLPAKLRAWGKIFDGAVDRVVVLVDLDDDDCSELLGRLSRLHQAINPRPEVAFRLAIEEVEAWYLGDLKAIKAGFPKAKTRRLALWQPDSSTGSWELFMEVIGAQSPDKVLWGEIMGIHLQVDEPLDDYNASMSFRKFCRRVRALAGYCPG